MFLKLGNADTAPKVRALPLRINQDSKRRGSFSVKVSDKTGASEAGMQTVIASANGSCPPHSTKPSQSVHGAEKSTQHALVCSNHTNNSNTKGSDTR